MTDTAFRLAEILDALEGVGVTCLVLGGHAARYYGVERTTSDFDLHLAPDGWPDLPERLVRSPLLAGRPAIEGPSWRPNDFRRFQIGRLPDGREEWLEFWRHNHLLPPFGDLFARREEGSYGGRRISFFSLPDLIRSKETERASDWLDVERLEEILDARLLAGVSSGTIEVAAALAQLRSRTGLQGHLERGHLGDETAVERAMSQARGPITLAYLLPSAPRATGHSSLARIDAVIVNRLVSVVPGSPLHLALVEAVRRLYKLSCQEADRADKQAILAAQGGAG